MIAVRHNGGELAAAHACLPMCAYGIFPDWQQEPTVRIVLIATIWLVAAVSAHAQSPGWGHATSPLPPPPKPGAAPINIVGKWHYKTLDKNIPESVGIDFARNHHYVQLIAFPKSPELGRQVMMIEGRYKLRGDKLSVFPTTLRVLGGPDPKQICGMSSGMCATPPLIPVMVQVAMPDTDTLQMAVGVAKRMP